MWNININTWLNAMDKTPCKTIPYADDVAGAATGKYPKLMLIVL